MFNRSSRTSGLARWYWKWKIVGIAVLLFGAVGCCGPYLFDQTGFQLDDQDSQTILTDIIDFIRGYTYYSLIISVSGGLLLYCLMDFDEATQSDTGG